MSSFLDRVAEQVAPWLCLQPSQLWPISSQSAPFLVALWLCLATIMLALILNKNKNSALERAKKIRYDTKIKTLKNLVLMEDRRLAHKTKDVETDKKEHGLDEMSIEENPPTSQFIYDIVFEKVEGESIDKAVGIRKSDPWYLRAVLFLRKRIADEIKEAQEHTVQAQKLFSDLNISKQQQIMLDHQDGEKLAKLIDFAKENILSDFVKLYGTKVQTPGRVEDFSLNNFNAEYLNENVKEMEILDRNVITGAEKVLYDVRAAQRNALLFIFDILRPVLPTFGLAILFQVLSHAFEAPMWAVTLPAYKSSIAMINLNATVGQFGYAPQVLESAKQHALLFIVALIFSRPVEMLAFSFSERATRDFSGPLRTAVMGAILRQDTEYFDFHTSAKLQERLNRDTNDIVTNLLDIPLKVTGFTFRVIQRIATLYFAAPSMLWGCLCFNVPVFTIISLAIERFLNRLCEQRDRSQDSAKTDTLEVLQKVRTVRQFSMEREETNKYTLNNLIGTLFENRLRLIEELSGQSGFLAHIIGEIYVIYVALLLAVDGEATVIDAIVASTVGMWLQHDMKNLLEMVPKIVKITKPIYRVSSLLACRPRIEQDPTSTPNEKLLRPQKFQGCIEFRDVLFSYPKERQKMVLNGLSFSARPGQKVALVGKAGCGKSTTMDLLQRFYDRNGGEILIDHVPIEKYDIGVLRKHSGVVAQTNVLFNRSLYENVVYGMEDPPSPESEEFKEVCEQAQAWDFIQAFPNKQYTLTGEEGVKLSGGQQQRIAIARVMIRRPTFLFLDEATSSLDAINEKAVQQAMDRMLDAFNGVAIVVAHRLTTICNCDKIIVMGDKGTKVEEGTHQELLQKPKQVDENGTPAVGPGLYHTLWDIQQTEGSVDGGGSGGGDVELIDLVKRLEAQIESQQKQIEQMKKKIATH